MDNLLCKIKAFQHNKDRESVCVSKRKAMKKEEDVRESIKETTKRYLCVCRKRIERDKEKLTNRFDEIEMCFLSVLRTYT